MSYEHFIARRFLLREAGNFSQPLVRIATYTIALGVVVMILAVCILRGFQNEITGKVVGFGSHITLRSYGWVNDYDEMSLSLTENEIELVRNIPGISHLQGYAYKGGMLKTDDQIQGIVFKGVDSNFDTAFFAQHLLRGRFPSTAGTDGRASTEVLVSSHLSRRMGIDTGSKARAYFWVGDNYRARAFNVVGVYNTDLSEFDDHYIIGDLRQMQQLNRWDSSEVGGYELLVDDFSRLDEITSSVKSATRPDVNVTTIREEQPSMFAWLELLNSNIYLILAIMAVVCSASIVSALLIMIFEKTSMIGILKTLGSTNRSIRRIFMHKAVGIIVKGLLFGNAAALLLCLLQSRFHLIRLDPESYSMTFVPVEINAIYFLSVTAGTLILCLLALLLPSSYIAHIDPAKTVRVE